MLRLSGDDPRATALTAAIQGGDVPFLQRQLRDDPALAGARIVDGRGVARTPLHLAADWPGHFPNGAEVVAVLLGAGADVDARVELPGGTGASETPLHWAASSDDVAVLDALLDGGADIEAPGAVFTAGTPLSDAVVFAQWRAAQRLLERGATTTLWQAAALGLVARVREIGEAAPAPSPQQLTNAFWHACRGGALDTAVWLLEQGADLNWVGYDDRTPLDAAVESGNADLIRWLREKGARPAADQA